MKNYLFILLCCFLFACEQTEPSPPETLEDYIGQNTRLPLVRDSLIACAAGGQENFMIDEERPISIFYYPEGNATNFMYYETATIDADPDDLSQFKIKLLPDAPIFNGYLRHFSREPTDQNIWCRVSYTKNNRLYISNAIRLKYDDFPSEFNPELLTIDQTENLSPVFNWQAGRIPENAIYFQVVSDTENNLLSGTYTFEERFQFYNLENVVLNIRDITPAPALTSENDYRFLLMGVSSDNWVNLIIEKGFDTR